MSAPIALFVVAVLSALASVRHRRRWRRGLPARAVIVSPRKSTVIARDGAVRSVQSAELTMAAEDLERLWTAASLENLARTYWRFLSRVTLGVVRVVYGQDERSVVLLAKPLALLRFGAPEYVLDGNQGRVCWRIRDGLLVARAGRGSGFLSLDVRRPVMAADGSTATGPAPPTPETGAPAPGRVLQIEVEVANFYPAIAANFSLPVYEATQSSIHVLVTHAFLRSLATLDLAQSKVGTFAGRLSRTGRR